jgi:hypothetical protein
MPLTFAPAQKEFKWLFPHSARTSTSAGKATEEKEDEPHVCRVHMHGYIGNTPFAIDSTPGLVAIE